MSTDPQLQQFRLMARYNTWINARTYDVAASLTDEERTRDLGAFFGSVHATLNHLLLTDRIWMGRFATCMEVRFASLADAALIHRYDSLRQELHADFADLRRERAETDRVLEDWTDELTAEHLAAPMRYVTHAGERREHPLWFAVAHLFNHQTHHRSQATTLLNQLGRDYGVTDFLAMYSLAPDALTG